MKSRLVIATLLVTGCASGALRAASPAPALKPIFETDRSLLEQPWQIQIPSLRPAASARATHPSHSPDRPSPAPESRAPAARPLWPALEFKLRVARPPREIDQLMVAPPPARHSYSLIIVDPELRTRSPMRADADAATKP